MSNVYISSGYGDESGDLVCECITSSPDDTKRLAATLAAHVRANDVIVLAGDLGAGKTQFVQGVAKELGVQTEVTSPSFALLLEYRGGLLPVFHFDLYRLDDALQLDDIAYFETLEAGGVSFVEWGDKFLEAMPYDYLYISLHAISTEQRRVSIRSCGSSSRALLTRWAHDVRLPVGYQAALSNEMQHE